MKSLISPEKIVRGRQTSPKAFYNFMTGGKSSESTSSVGSTANNIVRFTGGSVKPRSSNMASMISNISTNVSNNYTENVSNNSNISSLVTKISSNVSKNESKNITNVVSQNINKNFSTIINKLTTQFKDVVGKTQKQIESTNKNFTAVVDKINNQFKDVVKKTQLQAEAANKNVSGVITKITEQIKDEKEKTQKQVGVTLQNLIQNFKKDYQQQVQNKDDSKPSSVLKNFLGLYKNAIDLVNYFGDSRNHKRISNSLKNLRKLFTESFEVATVIRQSISKIVKQLSNLPTASGTAPDLNIDVKVPSGSLKQMGTRTVNQFTKGQGMSAGVGMLGLGLLGAGAAAYGMNRAREFQERELYSKAKGVEKSPEVPSDFVDGLKNIISKLVESIDKLVAMGQKPSSRRSSSSSTAQTTQGDQTSGSAGLEGVSPPVAAPVSQEITSLSGGVENYNIFKETIAKIESGGEYNKQGGAGNAFYGRYQLGRPEMVSAAQRANIPVPTTEEFKNNPQLQETLMQNYTMMNHLTLMQYSPKYRNMPPAERLKVLGYAHNAGAGGAASWVESGMGAGSKDSFRTPSRRYYEEIGANLNNPSVLSGRTNQNVTQQNIQTSVAQAQAQPSAPILPPPPSPQQARPAQAQVGPKIINLPPEVISAPIQPQVNVQNKVVPPITTGSEANTPDVTGLMDTSNPENPYIFLPFSLGIMM